MEKMKRSITTYLPVFVLAILAILLWQNFDNKENAYIYPSECEPPYFSASVDVQKTDSTFLYTFKSIKLDHLPDGGRPLAQLMIRFSPLVAVDKFNISRGSLPENWEIKKEGSEIQLIGYSNPLPVDSEIQISLIAESINNLFPQTVFLNSPDNRTIIKEITSNHH